MIAIEREGARRKSGILTMRRSSCAYHDTKPFGDHVGTASTQNSADYMFYEEAEDVKDERFSDAHKARCNGHVVQLQPSKSKSQGDGVDSCSRPRFRMISI